MPLQASSYFCFTKEISNETVISVAMPLQASSYFCLITFMMLLLSLSRNAFAGK